VLDLDNTCNCNMYARVLVPPNLYIHTHITAHCTFNVTLIEVFCITYKLQ